MIIQLSLLTPISKTNLISAVITRLIIDDLLEGFDLLFDGWSDGTGAHFMGLFASHVDKRGVVQQPLLACSPTLDENTYIAVEFGEHFNFMLSFYR